MTSKKVLSLLAIFLVVAASITLVLEQRKSSSASTASVPYVPRIFEICFQKKLIGAKEAELAILPPTPSKKLVLWSDGVAP